jgi:hypothetical protein
MAVLPAKPFPSPEETGDYFSGTTSAPVILIT